MTRCLLELGHPVTAVDNDPEMLSHVPQAADRVLSDIENLDIEILYPVVLLASNLVNTPDRSVRSDLLSACRRHVTDEGVVILQRYQLDLQGWEPGDWVDRGPVSVRILWFEHQGTRFSASIQYQHADQMWTHTFSAAILDDDTMRAELARVGLRLERILDPARSWILAMPR
jgi:hypothetical protein